MRVPCHARVFRFRGQTGDRGERGVLGAALLAGHAAAAAAGEIEIHGGDAYTRLSGVGAQGEPFAAGDDGHRGSRWHIQPRFRRQRCAQDRQPVAAATRARRGRQDVDRDPGSAIGLDRPVSPTHENVL